jgi:hypothetical protein
MDSKAVASFLTGVAVNKPLRYELGKDPKRVLQAIGFEPGEADALIKELDALPKAPVSKGQEQAAPWSAQGAWSGQGVWAHAGVWSSEK